MTLMPRSNAFRLVEAFSRSNNKDPPPFSFTLCIPLESVTKLVYRASVGDVVDLQRNLPSVIIASERASSTGVSGYEKKKIDGVTCRPVRIIQQYRRPTRKKYLQSEIQHHISQKKNYSGVLHIISYDIRPTAVKKLTSAVGASHTQQYMIPYHSPCHRC